jgi:hypothetical protein
LDATKSRSIHWPRNFVTAAGMGTAPRGTRLLLPWAQIRSGRRRVRRR